MTEEKQKETSINSSWSLKRNGVLFTRRLARVHKLVKLFR